MASGPPLTSIVCRSLGCQSRLTTQPNCSWARLRQDALAQTGTIRPVKDASSCAFTVAASPIGEGAAGNSSRAAGHWSALYLEMTDCNLYSSAPQGVTVLDMLSYRRVVLLQNVAYAENVFIE